MTYVILIDKPGVYRMSGDRGLVMLERYRYRIGGETKLFMSVARAEAGARVRIIDSDNNINSIPQKFLGQHRSIESARAEVMSLHAPSVCGATVELIEQNNPDETALT